MTTEELLKTIGMNIKSFRIALGMTQAELAAVVGISESYCSQCETGDRMMGIDKLNSFSSALGTSIETLICGESRQIQESNVKILLEGLSDKQVKFVVGMLKLMKKEL